MGPGRLQRLIWIVGLAAVYAGVARLGLMLGAVGGFATLVWPPTGLALVALVLRGRGLWPGVLLGAFVVNWWVGAPPHLAVVIASGNTLEAVLGATGLRLLGCDDQLARIADVAKLAVVAACAAAISASIGVGTLALGGRLAGATDTAWLAWWLGDVMGALVIAPVLLVWRSPPARPAWWTVVEIGAVIAVGAAGGVAVFGGVAPAYEARLIYLLFPPMIWTGARFGMRGATAVVLVLSAVAIAGTVAGHGPFVRGPLYRSLLELQSFMAVAALSVLLLGAAIEERDRARRIALDAVTGRDDFVAIASHELRTPLAALVLQLDNLHHELAGQPDGDAHVATQVARAVRQSDRLSVLVHNLLDVSRIEAGQLQVSPESMDLAELARDIGDRAQEAATRAGCDLVVSAATGPVRGNWDRLRVGQVIDNLLANAFRYAAGKRVEIAIATDATTARVSVADQGVGMTPEELAEVFHRYRRGGQRKERGGLGVGLYIAQHIAAAHGGRLTVTSAIGAGTTVTLVLPRAGDKRS